MTMNKLSSSDINVKEILEQSPTGVQHDAERNGIKSLVPLKLTPDIEKEGIVKAFTIDKRRGNIILELNHEYQNRKIISAIYEDWTKTVRLFDKQLKKKGVSRKLSLELADILDNNYVKVSDLEARKGRGSSSREQE